MLTPFTIRLAGKTISVQAQFSQTRDICRDYLFDGKPDFSVCVTSKDILKERQRSEIQDLKQGKTPHNYSDKYLEALALYRKIADSFTQYQTLLIHGSAVSVDGNGYLFTAPSGTGKSTHVRLWRELLGERAIIINDDKPLISFGDGGVFIHGTPWCGKHHLNTNVSVPLKAICILTRGEKDCIEKLDRAEVMPILIQQTYRPQNAEGMHTVLSELDRLTRSVGLYRLACTMNLSAAQVSFEAMSGC